MVPKTKILTEGEWRSKNFLLNSMGSSSFHISKLSLERSIGVIDEIPDHTQEERATKQNSRQQATAPSADLMAPILHLQGSSAQLSLEHIIPRHLPPVVDDDAPTFVSSRIYGPTVYTFHIQ